MRREAFGLAGLLNDTEQLVDLLKRQALGFIHHEPDKSDTDETERAPDLQLKLGW